MTGLGEELSGGEAAEFSRHVAGLVAAGLPLGSGLRALGEELPAPRLRRALLAAAAAVEAGRPLDEALAAQGHRFPAHLRGLVVAGARAGDLGRVLGDYVRWADAGAEIRRKTLLSLAYPLTLLATSVVVFIVLCREVVGSFGKLFDDFGMVQPTATRVLIRLSALLQRVDGRALLAPVALIGLIWLADRLLLTAAQRSRFAASLPLLGRMWRWTALAEFSHLLGLLIEGRVPLSEALPLAGDAARDADLAEASRAAAAEVDAGRTLAEATARRPFPDAFSAMIAWAEGRRSLPEALHLVGGLFEARARAHASFVAAVCGTLAVVIALWGILFLWGAMMIPMVYIIYLISG